MTKNSNLSAIAKELGARGGNKRAKQLSPEQRTEIARMGAEAYWAKYPDRKKTAKESTPTGKKRKQ